MINTQQSNELGINHLTGHPIRPIQELHKAISNVDSFEIMIQAINDMFNSYLKCSRDYNEDGFNYRVSEFKILFVELFQNLQNKDLDIMSKATGKPVRTIQEIYQQIKTNATLCENIQLLNAVSHDAIIAFSKDITDVKAHLYLVLLFREVWIEIFMNIHSGKGA